MKLSEKSLKILSTVHKDLIAVVIRAAEISPVDFRVHEGIRTKERQALLVKSGASKTMNSRHLTAHAVDLVVQLNGKDCWDWPLYHKLAPAMKQAAKELKVDLEWGGDWKTFKDGPHFQLARKSYP